MKLITIIVAIRTSLVGFGAHTTLPMSAILEIDMVSGRTVPGRDGTLVEASSEGEERLSMHTLRGTNL